MNVFALVAYSKAGARRRQRSILLVSAGLYPAGVMGEIVNDDGTVARVPDLSPVLQEIRDLHDDYSRGLGAVPIGMGLRKREPTLRAIDGALPSVSKELCYRARLLLRAALCRPL